MKKQFGWMVTLIVVAALWNGPAIAGAVVDYARNADRVDGFHAVGAGTEEDKRGRKVVATNKRGRLPDGIVENVPSADNADKIDLYDSTDLAKTCESGSVAGYAVVPADVGADWTEVPGAGFTKLIGGPPPPPGSRGESCQTSTPSARRLVTGTYEVSMYTQFPMCQTFGLSEENFATVVSVRDARPLIASYEAECREAEGAGQRRVTQTVRITDMQGAPADAAFTMATFKSPVVPLP